eukprot:11184105-Lingulodinium_polyedra.AAC.1
MHLPRSCSACCLRACHDVWAPPKLCLMRTCVQQGYCHAWRSPHLGLYGVVDALVELDVGFDGIPDGNQERIEIGREQA